MLDISTRSAARVVFWGCLAFEVVLVLLDYHVNYGRLTDVGALRRLTNIAREDSLASWFGTTQTLLVALTAWGLWLGARAARASGWNRSGWLLVAVLFTYMAVDDGAQIHERIGAAYRAADGLGTTLFPSFAWHVLYVPVLGAAVLGSGVFLWWELRDRWSVALVAAAIAMFAVAVGLDFFEGLDPDHAWNPYSAITREYDLSSFTRARFGQSPYATLVHFSRSIEEFLEMLANTCFWTALVRHVGVVMPSVRFQPTR